MNEEELKKIWKKAESVSLKNVNIELLGRRALESQNKLQKKIKWDITINVLFYVFFAPVFFRYPETLFFLPFATAVWIWYLWETLRIYKLDANFQESENIKKFLAVKEKFLRNYVARTRYIAYLGSPVVWFAFFAVNMSIEATGNFWAVVSVILFFSEIFLFIIVEIYIRKIYAPVIDELRDLLQQLND
jgi:hypothetical protein